MPTSADELERNKVLVRLDAIDEREMRGLVLDAWAMCVPKSVAAAYDARARSPRGVDAARARS